MEATAALAGTAAFPLPPGATTADHVSFLQQASDRPATAAAPLEHQQQQQQHQKIQGFKGWPQQRGSSPQHEDSSPQEEQSTQQVSPQQQSPQQQQQQQQEYRAAAGGLPPFGAQEEDAEQQQDEEEPQELQQQETEKTGLPNAQRRRGPPTEEERQRVREKYRERLKERKLQIYQRALQEVIQREKEGAQTRLLFKIHVPTRFGENLYIIGNEACVGAWCLDRAIPMQWTEGNVWSLSLSLPNGMRWLEYKYVIKEGLRITWEPGQNHCWGSRTPTAAKGARAASGPIPVSDLWGGGATA